MKNKGGILKNLSLIGCIAAMILLVTPAVSAEVFFPPPYSMNIIPGQYPVYQGFISGFSGSFVQPVEAVPSYRPLVPTIQAPVPDHQDPEAREPGSCAPSNLIFPMNMHAGIFCMESVHRNPGS
jgi:hypothetical protein